ncbi:MAG: phosphatase PAP2 family protein [Armatimonadetes bacterium]|nr:phosphatase PAP2 family protein [Armatimonadota bacterium]
MRSQTAVDRQVTHSRATASLRQIGRAMLRCWLLMLPFGTAVPATFGGDGGDDSGSGGSPISPPDTALMDSVHTQSQSHDNPGFFRRLADDIVRQGSSPFRMDGTDLLWLGGATAITAGLIAIDEPFDNQVKDLKERRSWITNSSEIITEFGGNYGIGAAALFAGYSFIWNDPKGKETSAMLAQALITSGLWTRLGKFLTGRERPSNAYSEGRAIGTWYGPLLQCNGDHRFGGPKFDAFPSGHTATAFAIATVFAEQYNQTLTVPILAYGLAGIVGFSRTLEHTHWISDVVVGAALGYLCGRDVVAGYRPPQPATPTAPTEPSPPAEGGLRWDISPFLTSQAAGVGITLSVTALVN